MKKFLLMAGFYLLSTSISIAANQDKKPNRYRCFAVCDEKLLMCMRDKKNKKKYGKKLRIVCSKPLGSCNSKCNKMSK